MLITTASVTKGMSENAVDNVHKVADVVIHPIALAKEGHLAQVGRDTPGGSEEREDLTAEDGRTKGFASSIVPTLEEKTIFERRPNATHASGKPLFDLIEEEGSRATSDEGHGSHHGHERGPAEAEVAKEAKEPESILAENDGKASKMEKAKAPKISSDPEKKELFGKPANATDEDDKSPNSGIGREEQTEDEKRAIAARKTLRKHLHAKTAMTAWSMPTPTPKINPNQFADPLDERFWKDMWVAVAVHNTEIFRKVFRCIPDDLVTTWSAYKDFASLAEKHNRTPENVAEKGHDEPVKVVHDGPGTHGAGGGGSGGGAVGQGKENTGREGGADTQKSDLVDSGAGGLKPPNTVQEKVQDVLKSAKDSTKAVDKGSKEKTGKKDDKSRKSRRGSQSGSGSGSGSGTSADEDSGDDLGKRSPSGPTAAWAQWERDEMEELLQEVRGNLGESLFSIPSFLPVILPFFRYCVILRPCVLPLLLCNPV